MTYNTYSSLIHSLFITFLTAAIKSSYLIHVLLSLKAIIPASLHTVSQSAPLAPFISLLILSNSTFLLRFIFLLCIFKISIRPYSSGKGISIIRSILPGLNNAGSNISTLFVAIISFILSFGVNPSN